MMRRVIIILIGLQLGIAMQAGEPAELSPREMALTGYEVLSAGDYPEPVNVWALDLTRRSAEKGDPVALNNLGYFAATGVMRQLPGLENEDLAVKDPEAAGDYYKAAMQKGMLSAALNLLELHDSDSGVQIDSETLAKAHMMVGRGYALGNNILPYDFEAANSHYLAAARLGNPQAIEIIREIIGQFPDSFGELTPEDVEMIWE